MSKGIGSRTWGPGVGEASGGQRQHGSPTHTLPIGVKIMQKAELCPQCGHYSLLFFIDPEIGGYVQCSYCKYTLTEETFDEAGE